MNLGMYDIFCFNFTQLAINIGNTFYDETNFSYLFQTDIEEGSCDLTARKISNFFLEIVMLVGQALLLANTRQYLVFIGILE